MEQTPVVRPDKRTGSRLQGELSGRCSEQEQQMELKRHAKAKSEEGETWFMFILLVCDLTRDFRGERCKSEKRVNLER